MLSMNGCHVCYGSKAVVITYAVLRQNYTQFRS